MTAGHVVIRHLCLVSKCPMYYFEILLWYIHYDIEFGCTLLDGLANKQLHFVARFNYLKRSNCSEN